MSYIYGAIDGDKSRSVPITVTQDGGKNYLDVNANLEVSDIQIGAVEIKDATTGDRALVNSEGQLHVVLQGKEDTNNSFASTSLGPGSVWIGSATDISAYAAITLQVYSDQASAANGLLVQFSSDASDWHDGESYDIGTGSTKFFTPPVQSKYYRVQYTNGSVASTDTHIHTMLKKQPIKWSSHNLKENLKDEDDGELNISVLKLRTAADNYVSGAATNNGNFKVSLEELESGISTNSNTQLRVTNYLSNGNEGIVAADSPSVDAFGRWRVSGTGQRLDVEFIYDKQPDFFDEVTVFGSVVHNPTSRDLTLSLVGSGNGSYALMRSHPVPYTPGNSQLIDLTGVLDLANIGTGSAEVFLRSNVTGTITEQTITQGSWVALTSGIDWSKSQIFSMDFQSLKVGRIQYYIIGSGVATKVANIYNDNIRNSGYWQLPSLPIYYKLYNTTGSTYMELGYGDDDNAIGFRYKTAPNASATMKAICCTVKSEGGKDLADMPGLSRSINTGTTATTVSTTLIPLLSIRARDFFNAGSNLVIGLPKSFSVTTDNPIQVQIIQNGSLSGDSWTVVNGSSSAFEYDVSAASIAGGEVVYSDYLSTARNVATRGQGLLGKEVLWNRLGSPNGYLTIAAIRTGVNNAACLAALNWDEIR